MVAVVIVTVIGIICIVVSFLLVGKDQPVSSSDGAPVERQITDDYELDEEEIAILQRKVSDRISADVNDIIYQADQSLSTMSNEKMIALGDYAVTVCDEIEKNHKEVMFLYSMLNDKEKSLKELVSDAEVRASDLRKANEEALDTYIRDVSTETETALDELEGETEEEDLFAETDEPLINEEDNTNDIILEMHKNGMGIMEIAKELGMGVGEVKLIVDLYQGDGE